MSLIQNLVNTPKKDQSKRTKSNNDDDDDGNMSSEEGSQKGPKRLARTAVDLQRWKLEKLMKNPDKPVVIPELKGPKEIGQSAPTFVRNVMGSSAGAGSGEFHVYRHLRRKEYARQKMIEMNSIRENLDDKYHHKIEENRRIADEKTAKKRAKRLKKKERVKRRRLAQKNNKNTQGADTRIDDAPDSSSSDENEDETKGESEVNRASSYVEMDKVKDEGETTMLAETDSTEITKEGAQRQDKNLEDKGEEDTQVNDSSKESNDKETNDNLEKHYQAENAEEQEATTGIDEET